LVFLLELTRYPVDPIEHSLESLLLLAEKAEKTTMTLLPVVINATEEEPKTLNEGFRANAHMPR